MSYLLSSKITIFPSAKRGVEYPYARLTTESVFSNIINKLLDSNGFMISSSANLNDPVEFNIYGYYVKVDKLQSIVSSLYPSTTPATNSVIYAQITIDSRSELYGQDDGGVYKGVTFGINSTKDLSSLETDTVHNQLLFQWNGSSWIIPEEAKFKFTRTSVTNLKVDGGEIVL